MLEKLLIRLLTPEVCLEGQLPDVLRSLADYLDRSSDQRLATLRVFARLYLMTSHLADISPLLINSGHLFYLGAIDILASIMIEDLIQKLTESGFTQSQIASVCSSEWGPIRRDLRAVFDDYSRLQETMKGEEVETVRRLVNSLIPPDGDIDEKHN